MLANFVLERAVNPGASQLLNLGGAPSGRRGFLAAFGNGGACYYAIDDGVEQEWGRGIVQAGTPNQLNRQEVLLNSRGTTERIPFSGAVSVYNDVPGERLAYFGAGNALEMMGRKAVNLGAGALATDAPNLGQVGWQQIGPAIDFNSPGQAALVFALPTTHRRFRLEYADIVPAGSTPRALFFRISADGGLNYRSGAADYQLTQTQNRGGVVGGLSAAVSYVSISPPTVTAQFGHVEFEPLASCFEATNYGNEPNVGFTRYDSAGQCAVTGRATHLLLSFVNESVQSARVRLLGGMQ